MKKTALMGVVALVMAFATVSKAEFNLGGEKFSALLDFCLRSRYQVQYGIAINTESMACQEIQLQHVESGVYVGSWWSQGIGRGPRDSRDEKDFYIGINRDVNRFNVDFQAQYLKLTGVGSLAEFALRIDSLDYPFYWKGSYLIGLKKNSPDSGFLNRAGFAKTFSIPLWEGYEQRIHPDVYVGGSIGGAVGVPSGVTHVGTKIGLPISIFKNVELTPTLGAQYTREKFRGEGKGKISPDNPVWGEISLTIKF